MSDPRIPTQKRSIEKRNKIIEKGFELMCNKGYYNTTTPDIAAYAGVSTGIIYQYFNDKKDIFIEGVKNYANNIMYPMLNLLDTEQFDTKNLNQLIKNMISSFITAHRISKTAHEELMAMSHLDDDISNIFKISEMEFTQKFVDIFTYSPYVIDHLEEKIHIIIGIVDNYCHEVVYHKHSELNYNVMNSLVIEIIENLLK